MIVRVPKRPLLTPVMIKAARELAGIDQTKLARLSGVTRKTVSVVERSSSDHVDARRRDVLEKIRSTFEFGFGLEFTFAGDPDGEGVRAGRNSDDVIG